VNDALSRGALEEPGLFPHLEELNRLPFVFSFDFGLDVLPESPGIILIRGPRQYGKSTWLERQLRETVASFGPGTAFYLNGDEVQDTENLYAQVRRLLSLFHVKTKIRRVFIDEITAVPDWQNALKRLADEGLLREVLVVTTGSKAVDLRRGSERLPGRKGRQARTTYYFTPISFGEFIRVCGQQVEKDPVLSYLLTGGSPVACAEIAEGGSIPEYVHEMNRDWILGDCTASGRNRSSLLSVFEVLHRYGGSPLGQAKLAREAGLANNTVAAGYIELLSDLMCLGQGAAWDESRKVTIARRPAKFHFINLLAAASWSFDRPRSVAEFNRLPPEAQGKWFEWLVAQELWRRSCISGELIPESLPYWQSKEHGADFVLNQTLFLEVKRGQASPMEFGWFDRVFPSSRLIVVSSGEFETQAIKGVTFQQFLELDTNSLSFSG
jgi:predicted AAA+ superfamily ATPase